MKISGIYRIVNAVTSDAYIGQSSNIKSRWSDHQRLLKRGTHHCAKLQAAWREFGAHAFKFEILEQVECDQLDEIERRYVLSDRPAYNTRVDGIRGAGRGWKHRPETIEKLRAASTGRHHSDESRERLRVIAKELAYRHPPGVRARISASNMGRKNPPEAIASMRAKLTGRKLSATHIANRSAALSGKPRSPEAARNAAEGLRRRMAERRAAGAPLKRPNRARRTDAKLGPEQIEQIRSLWMPGNQTRWKRVGPTIKELAAQFGVSYVTVWKVLNSIQRAA